eukprot:gene4790-5417_t
MKKCVCPDKLDLNSGSLLEHKRSQWFIRKQRATFIGHIIIVNNTTSNNNNISFQRGRKDRERKDKRMQNVVRLKMADAQRFHPSKSLVELAGRNAVFPPNRKLYENAHVKDMDTYRAMYQRSLDDPEGFWGDIAKTFYWKKWYDGEFLKYNFDVRNGPISIKFMEGAKTNICYNSLDIHVKDKNMGDTIAFYWEGNSPGDSSKITYNELLRKVCKFSNVLKKNGIKKGDRVAIYMPMTVEVIVAVLACARIGAVHSVVFAGFSADSLAGRMVDGQCSMLITADGFYRGPKLVKLKEIADAALAVCKKLRHTVSKCIVLRHISEFTSENDEAEANSHANGDDATPAKRPCRGFVAPWNPDVDCWWHEEMESASDEFEPEWMDAEDPLFILYTSGSTGKPKGVLHTVGGYLLYAATTFKYVFDYQPGETYWCTADVGWITGHSYVVYGPLANGATSVIFEGTPLYPDAGRCWEIVQKYQVNSFYTAPTAIRALMKFGTEYVREHNRSSLRVLGTVGEPINPEAWLWYYKYVGNENCSISDTFWQTETGGHVITGLPGATIMKPGSASLPFFGIVPAIMDEDGKEMEGPCDQGYLVIKRPWPGMMRTLYHNQPRFEAGYFNRFKGCYFAGDGAKRDEDGYYWITGRIDDCMNVSGHLLSTAQIESAIIENPAISEAAVVSAPHTIKGECVYCFVSLKNGEIFSDKLVKELKDIVRARIGPMATPEVIQNAPGLPKTRSGKIMRRVLRKVARNDRDLGDVSTMAESAVVDELFQNRPPVDL